MLTGSFKVEVPKGDKYYWVRDVCVKYDHIIDDLVVQVDAGVDLYAGVQHTLVFTVTHQSQPISWRAIASTNPCDVEGQYGDDGFRTFLSTGIEQDVPDRSYRLAMLELAYSEALSSIPLFEQHVDDGILKAAYRYSELLGSVGRANDREKAYRRAQRALSDLADVSQGMDYDFSDMQATLDYLDANHVPARPQSAAGRQDLSHANVRLDPYTWNISQAAPSSRRCPDQFVSNPVTVTLQPSGRDLQITVPVYVKHSGYIWLWDSV